jgi:hypothetical protein
MFVVIVTGLSFIRINPDLWQTSAADSIVLREVTGFLLGEAIINVWIPLFTLFAGLSCALSIFWQTHHTEWVVTTVRKGWQVVWVHGQGIGRRKPSGQGRVSTRL